MVSKSSFVTSVVLVCVFFTSCNGGRNDFTAGVNNPDEVIQRRKITSSLSQYSQEIDRYNLYHNRDLYNSIADSDIDNIINSIDLSKYISLDDIEMWRNTKHIRREIRDTPYDQWLKIADAINVMKFTDQRTGVSKYGNKFYNYDYLACLHGSGVLNKLGDQNHYSHAFATWHRAFLSVIEDSVLAIDSTIEGLPYWDYRRDASDPFNSIVFTDKYVGELVGDVYNNYGIKNGPFQYWPVANASISGPNKMCDLATNMWGQLRDTVQREKSPLITRYGGALCNKTNNNTGAVDEWDACLDTTTYSNYAEFVSCYFGPIHGPAHQFVGGTKGPNAGKELYYEKNEVYNVNTDSSCITWTDVTWVGNYDTGDMSVKHYAQSEFNCLFCPPCPLSDPSLECQSCHLVENLEGNCSINENDVIYYSRKMNSDQEEYIMGDFYDVATSFNDPFFFLHHVNMDRYSFIWQMINYDNGPYYEFPVKGYGEGLNLMDISNFDNPFYGVYSLFDENRKLSHKDILDATTLDNVPYMYDDIINAIETQLLLTEKKKEQAKQLQKTKIFVYLLFPIICITGYFLVGKYKNKQINKEMGYDYMVLP